MARDVELEEIMRVALGHSDQTTGKAMFGGWAFLLNGRILCAVSHEGTMFRVGHDNRDWAFTLPGVEQVVMRGRLMAGWVRVAPKMSKNTYQQKLLIDAALSFTKSLPPKSMAPAVGVQRRF